MASCECLNPWCLDGVSASLLKMTACWGSAFLRPFSHFSYCLQRPCIHSLLYFRKRKMLNTLINTNGFRPTWGGQLGIHIFIKLHRWFLCSLKLENCHREMGTELRLAGPFFQSRFLMSGSFISFRLNLICLLCVCVCACVLWERAREREGEREFNNERSVWVTITTETSTYSYCLRGKFHPESQAGSSGQLPRRKLGLFRLFLLLNTCLELPQGAGQESAWPLT